MKKRRLQSSTTNSLFVSSIRLSAVGCRVTDACVWNDLPLDITSSPLLLTFKE